MVRLIYQNGKLFDSIAGEFKDGQTVVIEDSKISWIGDSGSFEKDSDDKVVDVTNQTILPGLMDCHVHIEVENESMPTFDSYRFGRKESYLVLFGLRNVQQYLKFGVTTVRDCGGWVDRGASSIRRAIDDGLFVGPRLLVAQRAMRQYGDQENFGPESWIDVSKQDLVVGGRENIIEEVRDRKRNGSDFIKTQTTGGVLHGRESELGLSLWRDEELELMVDEAERLGMYIAAHAHTEPGINAAIRAGVRTIEHGSLMTENSAKLLAKKGNYLVPTHSPGHHFTTPGTMEEFPPEVQHRAKQVSTKKNEHHRIAFEKGVKIALGTDAPVGGNHPHTGLEVQLMIDNINMTVEQALQSATITAAQALQIDEQVGSIEVGKFADLAIVNGDLLADISLLQDAENFTHVVRNGKVVAEKGNLVN